MKIWLITGASRGFGALVAERALAKGDKVVATARNPRAVTERFGEHPNLLAVALKQVCAGFPTGRISDSVLRSDSGDGAWLGNLQ
jgi:NAD(P)-dependent dehydrogenase (short-subunit alcohol dehydrogenase family)